MYTCNGTLYVVRSRESLTFVLQILRLSSSFDVPSFPQEESIILCYRCSPENYSPNKELLTIKRT